MYGMFYEKCYSFPFSNALYLGFSLLFAVYSQPLKGHKLSTCVVDVTLINESIKRLPRKDDGDDYE